MARLKYYNTITESWENISVNGKDGKDGTKVHIDDIEPTDDSVLWIDTGEEAPSVNPDGDIVVAQSDWNAAEGQPGHVLNRTHYISREVILEETAVSTIPDSDDPFMVIPKHIVFDVGSEYTVVYNGTEYNCVAIDSAAFGEAGAVVLGNTSMFLGTDDTGEPFILISVTEGNEEFTIIIDATGATSAIVSIIGDVTHKLPVKFLPEGYPYTTMVYMEPVLFNGEAGGRDTIINGNMQFTKVSNQIPTKEDLYGATASGNMGGETITTEIPQEAIMDATDSIYFIVFENIPVVLVVLEDTTWPGNSSIEVSAGVWFINVPGELYLSRLSCVTEGMYVEQVKKLDSKFLPKIDTLPEPSTEGAFMRVVNGEWTAQLMSSAEGVSF